MYFITKNAKKKQYKEGGKLSSQSLVYRKKKSTCPLQYSVGTIGKCVKDLKSLV